MLFRSKKIAEKDILQLLKEDFIEKETELNILRFTYDSELPVARDRLLLNDNKMTVDRDQKCKKIYYSKLQDCRFNPKTAYNSPGIDLPVQNTVEIPPNGKEMIDTKIKFYIPSNYYGQIKARSSLTKLNIWLFSGVIDNDYSGTIKLVVKNLSDKLVRLNAGAFIAQMLIIPVLHPKLHLLDELEMLSERGIGSFGSSTEPSKRISKEDKKFFDSEKALTGMREAKRLARQGARMAVPKLNSIELLEKPFSFLEESCLHVLKNDFNIPYMNLNVRLPNDPELIKNIQREISEFNNSQPLLPISDFEDENLSEIEESELNSVKNLEDFVKNLLDETCETVSLINNCKVELMNNTVRNDVNDRKRLYQEENIMKMCKKLAVIAVEHLKGGSITKETLFRSQMSDDYLGPIIDECNENGEYENYLIMNDILYKKIWDNNLRQLKYCIALPDILVPSVIHQLHKILAHPSATVTLRNFQQYYHHRKSKNLIKEYVKNCITCGIAGKINVSKIPPGENRTMNPTAPRQCLYVDLLPCPKSRFQYILFCVDAYSQYVMTCPLMNKSGPVVLQGLMSIFSIAGVYQQIYFDNETSFSLAARELVSILPIEIHYSVPYAHHQNAAETHVKNFKRCFLKLLNDEENPTDNKDWDLLLPTITQSINRQIILVLGITREALHFNMPSSFYPLAHLDKEVQSEMQDAFDTFNYDFFRRLVRERFKRISKLNRAKVPQYSEGQLVLVKSQIPEQSSLFKLPYKGPYRIKNLGPRNVDLVDLESGKEHTSYIEFLKPLSVKEFKLVLSKNWDLHFNHQKRIRNEKAESILARSDEPYSLGEIFEIENRSENPPENEDSSSSDSDGENADYDPLEGTSSAYFNNGEALSLKFNPITMGRMLNKNDMDGLASLNNKIIDNLKESSKCGLGNALGMPSGPACAKSHLDGRELAFAKNLLEKETESERSHTLATKQVSGLDGTPSALIKEDVSQIIENNESEENMLNISVLNLKENDSECKQKKVGFKSFMTRFFEANK